MPHGWAKPRLWASLAVALSIPLFLAGCGGTGALHSQAASSPSIAGTSAPGSNTGGGSTSGNSGSGDSGSGTSSTGSTTGNSGSGDTGSSSNSGASNGSGGSSNGGTGDSGNSGGVQTGGAGAPSGGTQGGGASGGGTAGGGTAAGTGDTGDGGSTPGTTISNIQTASNWRSWGQVGPNYVDCSPSPCQGIQWSMKQGITLPSLSNNATKFSLGGSSGTVPYGDVLFAIGLIGQNSTNLKDRDHTLLPTLHHFTYDADFYVTNPSITQSLEFDMSLWMDNIAGMIFGTQCNYLGDHDWDIWNSKAGHWISAGVPCEFVKGWNHVTIRVQRQSDNSTLYQSITLNGKTYTLNKSYPARPCPGGWWGFDANYQMDGNYQQAANTTYLDNLSVTYW